MTYADIRRHYPDTWLLLEALTAHSQGEYRILETLAVIDTFADSLAALEAYRELHNAAPTRELYVVHSSKPELVVKERLWLGHLETIGFQAARAKF